MVEVSVLITVFVKRMFSLSFMKIFSAVKENTEKTRKARLKSRSSIVTLTLSQHVCFIGSAHSLTEINSLPKFNENISKDSGEGELTRKCF